MKKLFLMMVIAAIGFANQANAQPNWPPTSEPKLDLNTNCICASGGDITIVIYALDYNCNVVGITNPMTYPSSTMPGLSYSSISISPGWQMGNDPGAYSYGVNEWYFGAADFYNCVGVYSSGATNCTSGNYDFVHLTGQTASVGACGGLADDCFEYSTSCTQCSTGQYIHCHFEATPVPSGFVNSDALIDCP